METSLHNAACAVSRFIVIDPLTVMSYNIHKGKAYFSRKKTLHIIQDLMFELEPDIVFLQEFFRDEDAEKLLERAAGRVWEHHSYGQNAYSGDYHYGNAILSRYPIIETENLNISTNSWEQRGFLYAAIEPPNSQRIHLCCTHLNLTTAGRQLQIQQILSYIKDKAPEGSPLIFAGDFNDWNLKLQPLIQMHLHVQDALAAYKGSTVPTFPSIFPIFALDRIYCRNFDSIYAECLLDQKLRFQSDHLPIVAELKFQNLD